jgi:energy-coupling factor transport system permease protein
MIGASYISKNTFLHRLDGRTKLVAMLTIFFLALMFTDPLFIGALLIVVLIAWASACLPIGMLKTILSYFLWIAAVIFVIQVFFYPGITNVFRISDPVPAIGFSGYITKEGILFGFAMVLRLVVIMIVAPLLVMTTPIPELMLALVQFKIPYRFAFIMTTAMSLLPSIQNRSSIIQQAQLCRGVTDFEGGKIWDRLRATASMLVPLILGSFRDSQTLDVAMSSRAFGAPIKRTFLLETHLSPIDYVLIAIAFLLLVAGFILRLMNLGTI